ncbi:MAG TPA: ATP-binding protein [Tepidisphaeraceae bacterium]|jgi:serine/threonine-protein kinase RsbW
MTQPALNLNLTSDPAEIAGARHAVERFAADSGFHADAVADLGLCVNEALANIIRHAYQGARGRPIELRAEVTEGDAIITLRDWGNGRVPDVCDASLPDPAQPATFRPGGLGLPCMKKLLDSLSFEPQPDGMRLRMTKIKR